MWAGLCLPPRVQLSRHLAPLATALAALRAEAVSWAVKRTPSLEMAEEIVQQALLRAMAYLPQLRNPQRLRPWFYQILRHVLADELQRQQRWVVVDEVAPDRLMTDTQDDTPTCACILRVLEQLPVEAAALLRAADLQAQPVKKKRNYADDKPAPFPSRIHPSLASEKTAPFQTAPYPPFKLIL